MHYEAILFFMQRCQSVISYRFHVEKNSIVETKIYAAWLQGRRQKIFQGGGATEKIPKNSTI